MNTEPTGPLVWRTAGGDATRRGLYPRAVRWRREAGSWAAGRGGVKASVVFDGAGNAFVADMAGDLHARNRTGELLWSRSFGAGISATPVLALADAMVCAADHAGEVSAFDALTGAPRWTRRMSSARDPRILSDLLHLPGSSRIVFSSWSGRFFALDAATGETRLEWDAGISPRSAASAGEDEAVYCTRAVWGRGVELVRVSGHGEEAVLLREPEDSRGAGRALVAAAAVLDETRGRVYLVVNRERTGEIVAWSTGTAAVLWRRDVGAAVQGTPALLSGGEIMMGDLAGRVHGLTVDGERLFERDLGCDYLLAGGIGVGGDRFVIGDPLGRIWEVDRGGGAKRLFEVSRSVEGRPSIDPRGGLHVPCMDRRVHRLTPVGVPG